MGSYTVKPGESWASIAGSIYGNQRWLIELAKVNGGINRVLHPGDVIDAPDFDLTQTPVITQDQWAGVPTGMTGNTTNYGNVPTPTVTGPAATSKSKGTLTNGGMSGGKPYGPVPPPKPGSWGDKWQTSSGVGGYTPIPSALPQGTGYGGTAPTNGVPAAARQTGKPPVYTPSRNSPGPHGAMGDFTLKPPTPSGDPVANVLGNVWRQTAGAVGSVVNSIANRGDWMKPPTNVHQTDPAAIHRGANWGQPNAYNAAVPGPVPTSASDRSNTAWAARYTGIDIFDYYLNPNRPGYYLNDDILPLTVNARVANELPWKSYGFATAQEFMDSIGFSVGPDGNYVRRQKTKTSGYSGQTYSTSSASDSGGGGGYDYGGYTRGPASYGYSNSGAGLVQWRVTG